MSLINSSQCLGNGKHHKAEARMPALLVKALCRFKSYLRHHFKRYSFNRSFLCRLRVDKRIWVTKIQSRVFKGRTGRNAKHSISGISERKGDDLTGSIPDHAVVAHSKNNKQYRINDFFSTCFNSYCFKGLPIGDITLYPLKDKFA